MGRAGVPGFHDSPSHFDYVRAARKDAASPYRFVPPTRAAVHVGDMLCFNRSRRLFGYDGLAKLIDQGGGGMPMHCDIIVAIDAGKAYAIGGNVQQAVTMRSLPVDTQGRLSGLLYRSESDAACSPDAPDACNFNRQDWVVLLALKSQDELAQLGSVLPPGFQRNPPVPEACCVNCVLGSGIPRCPAPGQPSQVKPAPDEPLPGG
jgi:hypothetical protein